MIEFKTTIRENPSTKLVEFVQESADAPDATEAEIKYAKAFQLSCSVFKEHLSGPEPESN